MRIRGSYLSALLFSDTGLIIFAVILAVLLRGIPIIKDDYPSGPDYGLHLYYAELALQDGVLPQHIPYYQLGVGKWPILPGAPLIYAFYAVLSGQPVFYGSVYLTLVFPAIEVSGAYLLAQRLFARKDAAFLTAVALGSLPLYTNMLSWAGYPNAIALAFIPYAILGFLWYWDAPNWRRLILATVLICGTASLHHLSTLWLVLTLLISCLFFFLKQPLRTLRTIIPLGIGGIVLGLPVIIQILHVVSSQNAGAVLTQVGRFSNIRVPWETWTQLLTAFLPIMLLACVIRLLFLRGGDQATRVILTAYLLVSMVFAFGWVGGVQFYYPRALFFLGLPTAVGVGSIITALHTKYARILVAVVTIIALVSLSTQEGVRSAEQYRILTPAVMEATQWLVNNSKPDDVVVTSTFLAFHVARLIKRPFLGALSPDLIVDSAELPVAHDAFSILMGLYDADRQLIDRHVRYVMIRKNLYDIPGPLRSMSVIRANPHLALVYQNDDMAIFEVVR